MDDAKHLALTSFIEHFDNEVPTDPLGRPDAVFAARGFGVFVRASRSGAGRFTLRRQLR